MSPFAQPKGRKRHSPYARSGPSLVPAAREGQALARSASWTALASDLATSFLSLLPWSSSSSNQESKKRAPEEGREGSPKAKRVRRKSPVRIEPGYGDPPSKVFNNLIPPTSVTEPGKGRALPQAHSSQLVNHSRRDVPLRRDHSIVSSTYSFDDTIEPPPLSPIAREFSSPRIARTSSLTLPPQQLRASLTPQRASFGPIPARQKRDPSAPPLLGRAPPNNRPTSLGNFPKRLSNTRSNVRLGSGIPEDDHSRPTRDYTKLVLDPQFGITTQDEFERRAPSTQPFRAERALNSIETLRTPLLSSRIIPSGVSNSDQFSASVRLPRIPKVKVPLPGPRAEIVETKPPLGYGGRSRFLTPKAARMIEPYSGTGVLRKLLAKRKQEDGEVESGKKQEDGEGKRAWESDKLKDIEMEPASGKENEAMPEDKPMLQSPQVTATNDKPASRLIAPRTSTTSPASRSPASSLRAPRITQRAHAAPTPRNNKNIRGQFSAKFDDEDDEDGDLPGESELAKAARSIPLLSVPSGFSFKEPLKVNGNVENRLLTLDDTNSKSSSGETTPVMGKGDAAMITDEFPPGPAAIKWGIFPTAAEKPVIARDKTVEQPPSLVSEPADISPPTPPQTKNNVPVSVFSFGDLTKAPTPVATASAFGGGLLNGAASATATPTLPVSFDSPGVAPAKAIPFSFGALANSTTPKGPPPSRSVVPISAVPAPAKVVPFSFGALGSTTPTAPPPSNSGPPPISATPAFSFPSTTTAFPAFSSNFGASTKLTAPSQRPTIEIPKELPQMGVENDGNSSSKAEPLAEQAMQEPPSTEVEKRLPDSTYPAIQDESATTMGASIGKSAAKDPVNPFWLGDKKEPPPAKSLFGAKGPFGAKAFTNGKDSTSTKPSPFGSIAIPSTVTPAATPAPALPTLFGASTASTVDPKAPFSFGPLVPPPATDVVPKPSLPFSVTPTPTQTPPLFTPPASTNELPKFTFGTKAPVEDQNKSGSSVSQSTIDVPKPTLADNEVTKPLSPFALPAVAADVPKSPFSLPSVIPEAPRSPFHVPSSLPAQTTSTPAFTFGAPPKPSAATTTPFTFGPASATSSVFQFGDAPKPSFTAPGTPTTAELPLGSHSGTPEPERKGSFSFSLPPPAATGVTQITNPFASKPSSSSGSMFTFGAKPSTPDTTPTTSAPFTFGQPAPTTNGSTFTFGQPPAPAAGTTAFSFGSNPSSSFPPASGFGATTAVSAGPTIPSVFAKPATSPMEPAAAATNGFSFNFNTATANINNPFSATNGFNQPAPPTPSSPFHNTPTGSPVPSPALPPSLLFGGQVNNALAPAATPFAPTSAPSSPFGAPALPPAFGSGSATSSPTLGAPLPAFGATTPSQPFGAPVVAPIVRADGRPTSGMRRALKRDPAARAESLRKGREYQYGGS